MRYGLLEGHANGAEQIALKARDVGFEVIGLSMLSGSHLGLTAEVMEGLGAADMLDVPVVAGGIFPRHTDLNAIMEELVHVVVQSSR